MNNNLLQIAIEASKISGDIVKKYYKKPIKTINKGIRDFLTIADKESENFIKKYLNEKTPEINFLGEETGGNLNNELTWIVDPLDGTKNFAQDFPVFGVSIGLVKNKKPILGVINFPILNEIYSAEIGEDVFINNKKLIKKDRNHKTIEKSFIATGFPHSQPNYVKIFSKTFENILSKAMGIRRFGAATYDLCYVANGNFDAFWEYALSPWDTAAGVVIAQESGAIVTQCNGNPWFVDSDSILVSNPEIHKEMVSVINN